MSSTAHNAQANDEWAKNRDGCREKFSSQASYIGFRTAELDGKIGASRPRTTKVATREERNATAQREWQANHNGCRDRFIDEKTFTNYRTLELAGQIRST